MAWAKSEAAAIAAENPDIGVPAAFIAKMGADGRRRIDTEALAQQALEDLGRMRQEAFLKDATAPGGERIKDVALLERSIRMTTKFLDTYQRVGEQLWSYENNERLYAVLLDIVMQDLPKDKILPTMKRVKKFHDYRAQLGDPYDGLRTSPDGKVRPEVSLDDVPPASSDVPSASPNPVNIEAGVPPDPQKDRR